MVRRPVTLASMRSRQTGQVGSSRSRGVGGGAGRVWSPDEGDEGAWEGCRKGSSMKGKMVLKWVVEEDWNVTLLTNTT
jgi:hypothetical protein